MQYSCFHAALQCKIKCKVPLVLTSSSVTLSVVIPLYSLKFSNVTAQGIESIRNENNRIKMEMIEQLT